MSAELFDLVAREFEECGVRREQRVVDTVEVRSAAEVY